ncbi:MAG: hypothetical protein ABI729_04060 [Chitinophagales bacterium]
MKTSSKSLFTLIKALTKEERSYIMRTAIHYRKGGKNILVQLFKLLESFSPDEYDERKLAAKIPNLSVRKNELYETILRSLADRETVNLAVVMLGKLRWAAMLHYRKLFPEAISLLTEVEEWAKSQNQPYIHGVILQYKTFFANTGLYKNHNINFSTIGDSMVVNAQNILHTAEIYRQYVEVAKITRNSFLMRSNQEVHSIKELLESPVYNKDLTNLPVSSKGFLHLSLYYLYKLQADYEKAYAEAKQCWMLMNDASVDFSKRRPQEYLIAFIVYLAACIETKRLSESKKWLTEFRKLWLDNYKGNVVVGGKYYSLFLAYHYLEARDKVKTGIIKEVQEFYDKYQATLDEGGEGRALNYLLMLLFFARGDFLAAWDYCRVILNSSASAPRKELFDLTRILFLLVLFESRKFEELEYQCRQLNGFIRKRNTKEYLLEKTVIKHFQKINSDAALEKSMRTLLVNLSTDLEKLSASDNLCVKQFFHSFDFVSWVNQKIKNTAVKG